VDVCREREHEVALIGHEVLVEPVDHHDHGKDHTGKQRHDEQKDKQPVDERENTIVVLFKDPVGHARERGQRHDDQIERQHEPCGCTEFVLHQFSQHLNTSRNRASTDFPCFSRISSTEDCRAILPRLRKITSSRMFSTSAIRCVLMMTAASGL